MPSLARRVVDRRRRSQAQLFPLSREDLAGDVVGRQLPVNGGNRWRHDFVTDGARQIRVDVAQTLRVQAVANAHGEADVQAFAGLHGQHFALGLWGVARGGGVHLLARVV